MFEREPVARREPVRGWKGLQEGRLAWVEGEALCALPSPLLVTQTSAALDSTVGDGPSMGLQWSPRLARSYTYLASPSTTTAPRFLLRESEQLWLRM